MRGFRVKVDGRFVRVKLRKGMRVLDLMRLLGVNRETHLAKRNGELVSELEEVCEKDRVEVFGVVHAG